MASEYEIPAIHATNSRDEWPFQGREGSLKGIFVSHISRPPHVIALFCRWGGSDHLPTSFPFWNAQVTFVSPSGRFLWRSTRHRDTHRAGDGICVPARPRPACGPNSLSQNLGSQPSFGQPAYRQCASKSEHPTKTMPPNSHGQTWIRITCIFINGMRTISAQVIDNKQPHKMFLCVIVHYITTSQAGTALVVKAEFHLHRAHKGIGPMRATEGIAVI